MEMNTNLDLATFYAAKLNTTELAKLHELISDQLDAKYKKHHDTISGAIQAALDDGFQIEVWTKNGDVKIGNDDIIHLYLTLKE